MDPIVDANGPDSLAMTPSTYGAPPEVPEPADAPDPPEPPGLAAAVPELPFDELLPQPVAKTASAITIAPTIVHLGIPISPSRHISCPNDGQLRSPRNQGNTSYAKSHFRTVGR